MTVLIVLAMVIAFLLIDYVVQLRQTKGAVYAQVTANTYSSDTTANYFLPDGVFVLPGHLWSVLMPNGQIKIGIDRLVTNAIGSIEQIHMPLKGDHVSKGDVLLTVKHGKKMLRFRSPVDGVVMDINDSLYIQPNKISTHIDKSWTVCLKPANLAGAMQKWFLADSAREWLKSEIHRLRNFYAPLVAQPAFSATLQDGGLPVNGLLKKMEPADWKRFEEEFLVQTADHFGERKS